MASTDQGNQNIKRAEYVVQRAAVVIIVALVFSELYNTADVNLNTLTATVSGSPTITPIFYILFACLFLVPVASGMLRYLMKFSGMVGSVVNERVRRDLEDRLLSDDEAEDPEIGPDEEESDNGGETDREPPIRERSN